MVKMYQKLILLILCSLISFSALAEENDCLYYYYGTGCDDCTEPLAYLDQLQLKYPQLQVNKFDVYYDQNQLTELNQFFTAYNIPETSQGVPVVFLPGSYLVGQETIKQNLEDRILSNGNPRCPSTSEEGVIGLVGKSEPVNALDTLTFGKVTGNALSSSFSPAAIVLIVVLLIISMAMKDYNELLKKSILYIVFVFIIYLSYGLGMFTWFGQSNLSSLFAKIVGLFAIILSVLMVTNFFSGIFSKHISLVIKENIQKVLVEFTSGPGIIVLGLITAILTLSSSSSVSLLLRHLFKSVRWLVLPLTVYYYLIFLVPLIIVAIILYRIRKKLFEKAHRKAGGMDAEILVWQKHHLKVKNFFVSLVIFILGMALLF